MSEKKYYRFNELLYHHNVTADEIQYHIENSHLKLSFHLDCSPLLVGHYKEKKFIGHGRGSFSGIASVDKQTSLKLFVAKKAKCTNVFLRTNGFISYTPSLLIDVNVPNQIIDEWSPKPLSEVVKSPLIAKLNPHKAPSVNAFMSMMKSLADKQGNQIGYDPNRLEDCDLYVQDFKFTFEHSCLLTSDLIAVGLLGKNTVSKPRNTRLSPTDKTDAPNPNRLTAKPNRLNEQSLDAYYKRMSKGKRIVSNLIAYDANATASDLWLLLRKAQQNDEMLDLIDPDRDILEVTTDKILWNVPDNAPEKQKQITRGRFKNIVTELKK